MSDLSPRAKQLRAETYASYHDWIRETMIDDKLTNAACAIRDAFAASMNANPQPLTINITALAMILGEAAHQRCAVHDFDQNPPDEVDEWYRAYCEGICMALSEAAAKTAKGLRISDSPLGKANHP